MNSTDISDANNNATNTNTTNANEDNAKKAARGPVERYIRPDKRARLEAAAAEENLPKKVIAQFKTVDGEPTGPQLELDINISQEQLNELLNTLLNNDQKLPYSFYVNQSEEILDNLKDTVLAIQKQDKSSSSFSFENVLSIVYQPQALFKVRSVSRCTASLPGHTDSVLSVSFSPDGSRLASGSGDATVRLWDLNTETPLSTLKGHANWILAVAWSPDGRKLASGSKDCEVRVWNPDTGKPLCKPLRGHKKFITALCWEPYHLNPSCLRLASASKDGTIKVWDTVRSTCLFSLSGHTASVTCIRWGGEGFLYSGSQDRTIRVWNMNPGQGEATLVRTLEGHGHWVNTMALNTDYVLRTGPFDHECDASVLNLPAEESQRIARERYEKMKGAQPERLITGSDDFTMYLWEPATSKKPVARLTGHQALVNQVSFSPDGRIIASASFDKSIKLWDGQTGKYINSLRGHVGAVYQVCWSGDSRLLCSSSKDSTAKVWDVHTKKLRADLPGHYDEVYAVDWSPDGQRVCSGGKDRVLKIWRN